MYEIGLMILGAAVFYALTRFIGNIIFAIFLGLVFTAIAKVIGVI